MNHTYKALLIGEKSAGMLAVEIFENENLVWSRRFDSAGIFDMPKVIQNVVGTMENCQNSRDWGFGDDEPTDYDNEETTGIHARFEGGFWYFGKDYGLGGEVLDFVADKIISKIIFACELEKIVQFSKGWYLADFRYMIKEQKKWPDEDKAKEMNFHVAPYWLWIEENLIPIHEAEDLIEQMRGQA
jgi:hypothetical protein